VANTRRLLDTLVRTGVARRPAPGAPLEGPTGSGPSDREAEGFLEWFGESLAGRKKPVAGSVESEGLDDEDDLLLIRGVIGAARASGGLDADERTRIRDHLAAEGLGSAELALAERELESKAPFEPPASAKDDRRLAELLYAASLRSVDPSQPGGRGYVDSLARKLDLSADDVTGLQRRIGNR
jgi:uncharacterized membrane protein YebE (DUF533 family)